MTDRHVPSWQAAATPSVPQQPSGLPGQGTHVEASGWGQYGQPAQPGQPGQPDQHSAAPYGVPAPQAQAVNGFGAYNQLPYAQSGVSASGPQESPAIGFVAFVAGCVGLLLLLFLPWLATVIIGMVLCLVALGLGASSMRKAGLIGRFSILAFWFGVIGMLIGTITIIVMITLS